MFFHVCTFLRALKVPFAREVLSLNLPGMWPLISRLQTSFSSLLTYMDAFQKVDMKIVYSGHGLSSSR